MKLRRTIIAAATLVAVPAAAYISLPLWAPHALQLALPPELKVERLELQRPGWGALAIDRLALTYAAENWQLRADARDLHLQYRWRQLRRGKVDAVRAAELHIAVQQPAQTAPAGTAQTIALPTPAELLAALPVTQIDLPHIALELPAQPRMSNWSGSAQLRAGALSLALASATTPRIDLALRTDRDSRTALTLRRDGRPVAALHNSVDRARTLRGDMSVQLAPLASLLHEWGLLADTALRGTASVNWLGPLPTRLSADSWRTLALRGAIAADISVQREDSSAQSTAQAEYALAQGTLVLTFGTLAAHGSVAMPAAARDLISPQTSLPFAGQIAPKAELQLSLEPLRAALQGTIALSLGNAGGKTPGPLRAALTLANPEMRGSADGPQLRTRFALDAQLAQWRHTSYRLRQPRLQAEGELDGALPHGSLQLAAGMQLSAQSMRGANLVIAPLRAHSEQALTLNWRNREVNAASVQMQFDGSAIQLADQHYRFQRAAANARDLHIDLGDPLAARAQASFQLDGLAVPLGPYRTQGLGMGADLQLANAAVHGHWQLSTPVTGLTLRGDFRHDLHTARGMLSARLAPFSFVESGRYLPKLLENWSHPFDLSGGRLGLDARASWGAALKAEVDIDSRNLAGFYDMNVFKGLTAHPTFTYANGAVVLPTTRLTLEEVNVGFAVTQLQCEVAARWPDEFRIDTLSANLLGGSLTQPELHYRRHEKESRATWHFEGLQLGELVALEQNVEGSGVLDGELPVALSVDGIAIAGGEFQARAPGGVIRYRGELPQSTLAAVPALQLALDSLKNFHYQTLAVRTDYAPSGDLELGVSLRGRNPDLDEPRPVQFNLTIRENIPALLRSLQLSRDIGDKLEQRIQEFYQYQQQETP